MRWPSPTRVPSTTAPGRLPGPSPRGLNLEEAVRGREFIYANFWKKDARADSLDELLKMQSTNILELHPGAELTLDELVPGWGPTCRSSNTPERVTARP